jgi:hypothetical protein
MAALQAQVGAGADSLACPRLIHLWFPHTPRPDATPGCEGCVELQRKYEAASPEDRELRWAEQTERDATEEGNA